MLNLMNTLHQGCHGHSLLTLLPEVSHDFGINQKMSFGTFFSTSNVLIGIVYE